MKFRIYVRTFNLKCNHLNFRSRGIFKWTNSAAPCTSFEIFTIVFYKHTMISAVSQCCSAATSTVVTLCVVDTMWYGIKKAISLHGTLHITTLSPEGIILQKEMVEVVKDDLLLKSMEKNTSYILCKYWHLCR